MDFTKAHPYLTGIHFQPVSYFRALSGADAA